MKALRHIGSGAFVLGLFTVVFIGIPWHVLVTDDPAVPCVEEPLVTQPDRKVLLLNSDVLPGREISEILGLVQGHTVFAVWLGKDLSAIVRLILGGELTEYTEMMGSARSTATERMKAKAAAIGADAVINVRYMTTSVIGSAAELLVYGTAVKLS
jgi:uncharacterized protein YbjQ (UPF0145 family)